MGVQWWLVVEASTVEIGPLIVFFLAICEKVPRTICRNSALVLTQVTIELRLESSYAALCSGASFVNWRHVVAEKPPFEI